MPLTSLNLPLFRALRMLLVFVVLTLTISSCSVSDLAGSALKATLGGGGPSVNAQVGQNNTQGVSITKEAPTVTVRPKARVDNINQSTTNVTDISNELLALLIIGWLAPSPGEIGRGISRLWRRKDDTSI